jgi:hypothetical protein
LTLNAAKRSTEKQRSGFRIFGNLHRFHRQIPDQRPSSTHRQARGNQYKVVNPDSGRGALGRSWPPLQDPAQRAKLQGAEADADAIKRGHLPTPFLVSNRLGHQVSL